LGILYSYLIFYFFLFIERAKIIIFNETTKQTAYFISVHEFICSKVLCPHPLVANESEEERLNVSLSRNEGRAVLSSTVGKGLEGASPPQSPPYGCVLAYGN